MVATDTKAIEVVGKYIRSDASRMHFAEAVGERNVGSYINSVMLAVANDDSGKLALCTKESIYISALRAATLRLSVDPSTGQAYMVTFGNKATLIVGYKGLQDMAVRTGKYRYINVTEIYEGETVEPNRISGLITLESLGGKRVSDKVIGWLAAFEMNPDGGQKTGYAHTLYMTVEQIHEHAKKYSRGYDYKNSKGEFTSLWKKDPKNMERKTALRLLLRKWGYLDPVDKANLEVIEDESAPADAIDVEFSEAPAEVKEPKNEAQLMVELGNGSDPVSDTSWDAYLRLCQKADGMSLAYNNAARETWSNATLAKAHSDLEKFVKKNEKASA